MLFTNGDYYVLCLYYETQSDQTAAIVAFGQSNWSNKLTLDESIVRFCRLPLTKAELPAVSDYPFIFIEER